MSPMELINSLDNDLMELTQKNTELLKLGMKKDNTKKDYAIGLKKELLRLRLEKYPSTLCEDIAKGNEYIAKLRLEKDLAQNEYFNLISAMDIIKIRIEVKRSQLAWLKAELNNS